MSLGKLLAAGRCLVGMKDTDSPYRMNATSTLPKFGSQKNPFTTAPASAASKADSSRTIASVATVPVAVAAESKPEKFETQSLFDPAPAAPVARIIETPAPKVEPIPETITPRQAESVTVPKQISKPAVQESELPDRKGEGKLQKQEAPSVRPKTSLAEHARTMARAVAKLNPLRLLRLGKPGPTAVKVRPARAAVQAELSLERVRVVRNDLSDADLEIVQARPVAALREPAVQKLTVPVTPARAGEPTAWNRITSRLFGAGHTAVH